VDVIEGTTGPAEANPATPAPTAPKTPPPTARSSPTPTSTAPTSAAAPPSTASPIAAPVGPSVRTAPPAPPGTLLEPPSRRRRKVPPRKTKVVVRHVDPWSVFKFSLLFYFCLMLVAVFALMILYWILGLTGVLDSAGRILQHAGFGPQPTGTFRFNGTWIFERVFLIGVVGVFVWALVNLFVALLYNLVSDVVGGVSVTLTEKR
jgi:hypothetical protein